MPTPAQQMRLLAICDYTIRIVPNLELTRIVTKHDLFIVLDQISINNHGDYQGLIRMIRIMLNDVYDHISGCSDAHTNWERLAINGCLKIMEHDPPYAQRINELLRIVTKD